MALEAEYEVLCTLGEGSFGKVYKAKHRETGDEVAVKEIKLGAKSFSDALNSMELMALKALRHPCIVRLRELIRSQRDGSLFFIFEFIGSDLGRLIRENPRGLPEDQAIELMRQVLVGIAHIHQYGFFHRDVKPDNILFDPVKQTIRIADFGEARSLRARPPFTDYVGTRWYRAPECLLQDCNYSSPVDVWAAGLVFAEILRGSPIFKGSGSIDQLHQYWSVLGLPSLADWPDFERLSKGIRFRASEQGSCGLRRVLPSASPKVQAAIAGILIANPKKRLPARRCLETFEIFAKLTPLDLTPRRVDSGIESNAETSRVEDDLSAVVDGADSAASSPSRRQGFGIGGSTPVSCAQLDEDLDLDAELDEILAESPARPSGMRPTANNPNQASITSLLGSFSFAPGSRATSRLSQAGTTSRSSSKPLPNVNLTGSPHLSPLLMSPSPFDPSSPSGNIEALLASMEADLNTNHGSRRRPDRSASPDVLRDSTLASMPDLADFPG